MVCEPTKTGLAKFEKKQKIAFKVPDKESNIFGFPLVIYDYLTSSVEKYR